MNSSLRRLHLPVRLGALIFGALGLAPAAAHEPHRPPSPAVPAVPAAPATAAAPGASGGAAIPLPPGWVESSPPAAERSLAPRLTADGEGFLATWIEPMAGGAHRVRLARWHDGSWSAATTVSEGKKLLANWADVPGVVRAPDRALYVWWPESPAPAGEASDAQLARSTDEGATFRPLGRLHEDRSAVEHGFVSAVPEASGVRFFYLDGRATTTGAPTELRSVLVVGDRIGASELVDASVCDCCSTAAVALQGGSAVAYRARSAAEIRDIRLAARAADGRLRTTAVADDGWKIAGCPVNGPAIASHGKELAVAWFSAPGDRARMAMARSADGGEHWSPPQPLPAEKPMGRLALAEVPGGFAISWLEGVAGGAELRLAFAGASGKVVPSLPMARTGAGRAGGLPHLASAANRLALLWVDAKGLRFASAPAGALSVPAGSLRP